MESTKNTPDSKDTETQEEDTRILVEPRSPYIHEDTGIFFCRSCGGEHKVTVRQEIPENPAKISAGNKTAIRETEKILTSPYPLTGKDLEKFARRLRRINRRQNPERIQYLEQTQTPQSGHTKGQTQEQKNECSPNRVYERGFLAAARRVLMWCTAVILGLILTAILASVGVALLALMTAGVVAIGEAAASLVGGFPWTGN